MDLQGSPRPDHFTGKCKGEKKPEEQNKSVDDGQPRQYASDLIRVARIRKAGKTIATAAADIQWFNATTVEKTKAEIILTLGSKL